MLLGTNASGGPREGTSRALGILRLGVRRQRGHRCGCRVAKTTTRSATTVATAAAGRDELVTKLPTTIKTDGDTPVHMTARPCTACGCYQAFVFECNCGAVHSDVCYNCGGFVDIGHRTRATDLARRALNETRMVESSGAAP